MKNAICFFIHVLLFSFQLAAQDNNLVLKVNKLDPASITLKLNGNALDAEDGVIDINNDHWTFKVDTKSGIDFKVVISNTSGNIDSVILTEFAAEYDIQNNILKVGEGFKLSNNISISVERTEGGPVKLFSLKYKQGSDGKGLDTSTFKASSIIFDAFKLNDPNLEPGKKLKLLSYYAQVPATPDDVNSAYATNNFLKDYAKDVTGKVAIANSSPFPFSSSFSLSSVGGLDVTNIADGLAKFLVKRTKQELTIAFFDRLKKIIDSTKDLNTLFPQTAILLNAIGDEVYNYQNYIQNLREAFKEDIEALDKNLPYVVDNHPQFFERNKELDVSLRSACYIATELEIKAHPGDILANYPDEYLDKLGDKNLYKGAIQTIQLLSESLRDTTTEDDASYWVSIKQMRDLVNNKDAFKIYLGLILQQAKTKYDSIYYKEDGKSFAELLNTVGEKDYLNLYSSYKNYILRFGEKIDAINKMVKEDGEAATDSAKVEKYAKYFRAAVDMIEYCTSVSDLRLPNNATIGTQLKINLHSQLQPYFNIAYAVTDLATDINRRNYSAAINHTVYVYKEIVSKDHNAYAGNIIALNKLQNNTTKVDSLNKYYPSIFKNIERERETVLSDSLKIKIATDTLNKLAIAITSSNNPQTALSHLINFGAFMASVATAKNSDDVEAAIESAALPVGSSRIKRASAFNVSLNAYVGLFTGHEWIKGIDDKQTFNIAGVSAPIGIAVSWRLGYGKSAKLKDNTQGNSLSVFASLIDIGAVTTYRFSDMDSVAKLPTIELKDIIAPGIFVSWGIKGLPISLNAGYQLGPLLRNVGPEVNETVDNYYHRVIISANVDLPLLNLYNRKYKRSDLQ